MLISYNKTVSSIIHLFFALFLFWEKKECTERKAGKGARKPFVPSDEPEQSSDNHYGEAVRKGSGTSPLLRCPKNATARRSSLAFFDRCHSLASLPLPPAAVGSLPRDLPEYETVSCYVLLFPSSREVNEEPSFLFISRKLSAQISSAHGVDFT